MSNKFYLIDGHAQIFQSFYAIPNLSSPDGLPINAVYGFTAMLRRLLNKQSPYYLAVAFDTKGPTFRHEQYEKYKANRKPMPEELRPQIPLIAKIVEAFNIPIYLLEGFEADDIIGTIASILSAKKIETIIVTKDKDMEQLIDPNVKLLDLKKNFILDEEALKIKRGVKASQIVDLLAMVGDTSDNVPGVPGIGPKTATKLINEWGSLEGVLGNVDKLSSKKIKENLKQFVDQARLSKELVTINKNVPIDFKLEDCLVNGINNEESNLLFEEFGFKSFIN